MRPAQTMITMLIGQIRCPTVMDRNTAVAGNDVDLGAPTNLNTEPQQMNGSATAHVKASTLRIQRVIKKTEFCLKNLSSFSTLFFVLRG